MMLNRSHVPNQKLRERSWDFHCNPIGQYTVKDTINGRVQEVKLEFKISCGHIFRAVRVKSETMPKISHMEKKKRKKNAIWN